MKPIKLFLRDSLALIKGLHANLRDGIQVFRVLWELDRVVTREAIRLLKRVWRG